MERIIRINENDLKRMVSEAIHQLITDESVDVVNEDGGGACNCAGAGLGGDNTVFGTGFMNDSDPTYSRPVGGICFGRKTKKNKR